YNLNGLDVSYILEDEKDRGIITVNTQGSGILNKTNLSFLTFIYKDEPKPVEPKPIIPPIEETCNFICKIKKFFQKIIDKIKELKGKL
ncbi:MAG: hypothetical protein U9Q83_05135, partial [Bacteroidota bacterium]|nr:hypothetical protein [Bacteroidota bacterium]